MNIDVSVIIVTYNTCFLTKQCVDSIFKQTRDVSFEVIVWDNASTDETYSMLSKDNRIIYLYNSRNLGFGQANNEAFLNSRGKYILLLNSDTYLLNNAIGIFKEEMDKLDENVSCIGTLLLDKNEQIVTSYGDFMSYNSLFCKPILRRFCRNFSFPEDGIVDVIVGADLFIRRSIIEKLGFFDSRFFMYHEENDLQRRFRINGYYSKLIFGPKIVHLEGKSKVTNFLPIKGCFIYMRKWYPKTYILFRILYALTRFYKFINPNVSLKDKVILLKIFLFHR